LYNDDTPKNGVNILEHLVTIFEKVIKVRFTSNRIDGWLMDGVINYFGHNIGRNWPFDNIPWFLEFLSALIRRPDLDTILNDENYIHIFTTLANFTNGDSWCRLTGYEAEFQIFRYSNH